MREENQMNARTRNKLSWVALALCSTATVGTIVTGESGSGYFAAGVWAMAITVAALSRPWGATGSHE